MYLLNSAPPYFNGSAGSNSGGAVGFDAYVSNPIGRIVELGFTAKL